MKKLIEALKANRTLLLILALVFVLIAVVIVFYGDGENDADAAAERKSASEIKLEAILSAMDGVGESSVFVTEGDDGIEGVVVVCAGGDNIMTRNDIINAVSTALDIQKNIIAVYAMK